MAGLSSDCSPECPPAIWLVTESSAESSEGSAEASACLPDWLTQYERQTVSRFGGPRRREYLSSRWLIRQAIAGASGCGTASCYPVRGRPVASEQPPGWRLSLSHSHGLSACATSSGGAIGLDIEPRRRHAHWQKVVKRWFTPLEQTWLLSEDSAEHFLRVWTLKEAWLKATGRGIAGNLQTLEVRPGFELVGDQPDRNWQAGCYYVDDFLVTLVFEARDTRPVQAPQRITVFAPPPADFRLCESEVLTGAPAMVLQATIHTRR